MKDVEWKKKLWTPRVVKLLFNARSNFVLARFNSKGFGLSSRIELFPVKRELTSGQLPASGVSGESASVRGNWTEYEVGMAPAGVQRWPAKLVEG